MIDMYQWILAKSYDFIMKSAEYKCLREWRLALFKNISGDVLEIGCGTGVNLEFFPSQAVKRLALVEPNLHMHPLIKEKMSHYRFANIEILGNKAEELLFADACFDLVVSTLVLCTVTDVEKVLSEIHRVLRPQGKFIFIEHIAADTNLKRYQWQRRLEFLWKCIAGGCHVTRSTEEAIIKAGFRMTSISHEEIRGLPPIACPCIHGIAMKV